MGPASADATIHGPLRPSSESGTNLAARPLEEVPKEPAPVRRQDRLRMELDALDRIAAMPHAHDLTLVGGRDHLEVRRDRCRVDGQRVIPARGHWIRQTLEDCPAIVAHKARLPMEDSGRVAHLGAVGGPDPLVAQAYTHRWYRGAQLPEDVPAYSEVPCVRGMAGSWREDDRVGCERSNLAWRHRIVPMYDRLGTELADRLIKGIDE